MKPHVPLLILVVTYVAACAPPQGGGAAVADDEVHAAASAHVVEIPAGVRRNLGLTFARAEARKVAQTLRVPGAFELRPLARREYRMSLDGRVELRVDEYDRVEAGQLLYRFQSPNWPELLHEIILGEQEIDTARAAIDVGRAHVAEDRGRLERLRARLAALARADFKRADLETEAADLEAGLVRLAAEVRQAEVRLANAERTREHALHRAATAADLTEDELEREVQVGGERVPRYTTLDWIEVHAERPGVVEALAVTDGAFVESSDLVLSCVAPEQVRLRALALQADLPRLGKPQEARIVPPRSPGLPLGEAVPATMTLGLEAHPRERTLEVLATPEGEAPWIRPGVSAFLEVVVASSDGPELAIPRSAVVQDGLERVFFRRDPEDPDRAIRVRADLGVDDGRWVVVKSGLMRGDEVVVQGAYELKLALDQSGIASSGGHVHADGSTH